MRRGLLAEAGLELGDPRLDRGDLTLELGDTVFDDLTAALLVGLQALDPAQRLGDRVVFLLEAVEPAVNLVEVPEHFAEALVDVRLEGVEALLERVEATADQRELAIDPGELTIDPRELTVDLSELASDLGKLVVNSRELALEELDELLVLRIRHASRVAPVSGSVQVSPICDTERAT